MNKIVLAAAAAIAFTGVAAAQEAPVFVGNYGAAVENSQMINATKADPSIDRTTTASISRNTSGNPSLTQAEADLRSGR
ncbi:MAG: hypothetical protein H6893_01600 [Brucellaceae bacterium]|nr:hypothetical protein [Brucellaceae bacterium]MCO5057963.1 hypothetical protein [Rhizobiaceae bacterium]